MRGAPAGRVVKLWMDWVFRSDDDPPPAPGNVIVSNGGSVYLVLESAPNRNRPHRHRMACLKLASLEDADPAARRIGLQWYPRKRKRGTHRQ